ncbi:MAG TPA: hypothetical protein VE398_01725 [Acidobacteriota bacterium]|nr:hypothetical protein [Acidobacteriota bacterium]
MITRFTLRARHVATVITMLLLAALASAPAIAQEQYVNPVQVKMALYDMVRIIERTTLRDSKVSDALLHSDPEVWRGIQNPQDVLKAADFFRKNDEARETQMRQRLMNPLSEAGINKSLGSQPFPPNYPIMDANYLVLLAFGLVTDGDYEHRSNGVGFIGNALPDPYKGLGWLAYKSALVGAAVAVRAGQLGCTAVAGVPGVETATCAAYAVVQGALDIASIPLNAASAWDAQIDSAEIEGAYRNAVLVLGDLSAHDDGQLSAIGEVSSSLKTHINSLTEHDKWVRAKLQEQSDRQDELKKAINEKLAQLLSNQQVIIKLLKTPEGKRPGWGSEGYK